MRVLDRQCLLFLVAVSIHNAIQYRPNGVIAWLGIFTIEFYCECVATPGEPWSENGQCYTAVVEWTSSGDQPMFAQRDTQTVHATPTTFRVGLGIYSSQCDKIGLQ